MNEWVPTGHSSPVQPAEARSLASDDASLAFSSRRALSGGESGGAAASPGLECRNMALTAASAVSVSDRLSAENRRRDDRKRDDGEQRGIAHTFPLVRL